ncbi:hypothetical protein MTE01_27690 [Microbacterium testaceum]|uniref:LA2681-like HEPN domain-containing protein n=2 Tax=Microbacterium testaceum TaxID=2033 RepID=A0A4Y3QNG7_MICTE|nr:hypothetical protein MTE01_27690 [Microbacterium testaceum]
MRDIHGELDRLAQLPDQARMRVLTGVQEQIARLRQLHAPTEVSTEDYYEVLCRAAGMMSDAIPPGSRDDVLVDAEESFREVMAADVSESLKAWAAYSLGTTVSEQIDVAERRRWASKDGYDPEEQPLRWSLRERLRETRLLLAGTGHSPYVEPILRSKALCNLGNALDTSGRWLEAYEAYQDSLTEYPNNGNAAGNIAELLASRIRLRRGQPGHYAALFNRYARLAKRLREHTIGISSEAAADGWDALREIDGVGHESHDGDSGDFYQRWVAQNRLALSVAMEGLGSEGPRWDDADVEAALIPTDSPTPLAIFAAVNVLKSEYLVARRLAYDGIVELADGATDESGTYAETNDNSVFGQPAAKIVLAQRATLDVLDKIAVVANLYFEVGDPADRVKFRTFWTNRKTSELRPELPQFKPWPNYRFALAELAYDVDENGLYADAQLLRNAGTHRLVHVKRDGYTGPTRDAIVSVGEKDLASASLQALRVARAAYLYLLDFIAEDYLAFGDEDQPTTLIETRLS